MSDTELGGLIVRMKADTSDYQQKLEQMGNSTAKVSEKVSLAFNGIAKVLAVTGTAMGSFAALSINSAMKWGNAVDDLSDKTGMAGEEASKLLVLAKRVGIGMDEAGMMFSRFARSAYEAAQAQVTAKASGESATDVYSKLGVSVVNANNTMKTASEIFGEVKDKISQMPDGLQKTAYEMELFGRSGAAMHDLLNMSKEDMDAVIKKAQAMGLIISSETAAAWEQFERNLNSAKGTLTSVGIQIGNEMLPQLQELLSSVQNTTKAFISLDPETKENIMSFIKLGTEIGFATIAANKAFSALNSLGVVAMTGAPLWLKLAIAIGTATGALYEWMAAKSKVDGYGGGGEIRKSTSLNYGDDDWKTNYYVKRDTSNMSLEEKGLAALNHFLSTPIGQEGPAWDERPATQAEVNAIDQSKREPWNMKGDLSYNKALNDPAYLARLKAQQLEDQMRKIMDDASKYAISPDVSGGKSAADPKTALQSYQEAFQKAQQEMQGYVDLGQLSAKDYVAFLDNQLKYVDKMNVGADEQTDKQLLMLDIAKEIQSQQRQMSQEEIQTASQKVQMGQMTLDQYKAVLEEQMKLATNDKDRLALAVQIYQENQKILEQKEKEIDAQADSSMAAMQLQQEKDRHSLQMSETFSDGSNQSKLSNMALENNQAKLYLEEQHKIEIDALKSKMDLRDKDSDDYKKFLEEKKKLDAKYDLDKQKLEDDYAEKVAAQQKAIIDANNRMISDLITGTKSGHDVLKDMWYEFVDQIVAKMFSIQSSMNIFTNLFGSIFGLSSSGGNAFQLSNGTTLDSNFGIDLSALGLSGARAGGGDVEAGKSYLVGEKGIEIFTPSTSGSIIPNSYITSGQAAQALGGGQSNTYQSNVTVQQNFTGQQDASVVSQIKASIPYIKREVQNAIANETSMRNTVRRAAGNAG